MSSVYGQVTTFDSANTLSNIRVSIEDLVSKYPAKKFPLITRLNGKIFDKAVDNPKYEWKQEILRPEKDVLNGAISSTSATSIVVTTSGVFNVDDVILIDSEYMIVTGVTNGLTLTVVRGWNSTGATHSDLATVRRVGIAAREGADADGGVIQGLDDLYNYTQIFEDIVEMTGTEEQAFLYRTKEGNNNSSNQITKKQQELMEVLQAAMIFGTRYSDSSTKRRTMAGLKYFVDTYASGNVFDMGGSSAWTTETSSTLSGSGITIAQQKLDDTIQQLVSQRANPSALYVGYKALRKMTAWDASKSKTDRNDKERGYQVPATYISQAGDLDIVQLQGNLLDDYIFVVDESLIGYKSFVNRGWFTKKLSEGGDNSKWQVLGEYTFKVSTPTAAVGYVHNLGL